MLDLILAMDRTRHQPVGMILSSDGPTADCFRANGIPVLSASLPQAAVRNPKACWRFLSWGTRLAWQLRRQRPDLINAAYHEVNRHAVLIGALLRRPVVCHLFDDTPASLYRIRWAHRNAAIIACSHAIASQWESIPDAKPKLHVVYPGIDHTQFRPQPGARVRLRREFAIADDELLIGVVSRLSPEKGVRDFVEAFALCMTRGRQARAVVVGDACVSTAAYGREVRRRAADLGDRISFAGFRSDVADCYAAFDLLVVPSRHEGFGRVLVEGMAAGLPVVATKTEGIPEVVVHGETGLLAEPGRPEALAEAMMRLLANPDLAHRMGRAGRERAKRFFTIQAQAQAMQALYEEVIRAPHPGLGSGRRQAPAQRLRSEEPALRGTKGSALR
jgi:glycosyltransferase involved in cell wall biosynthesis